MNKYLILVAFFLTLWGGYAYSEQAVVPRLSQASVSREPINAENVPIRALSATELSQQLQVYNKLHAEQREILKSQLSEQQKCQLFWSGDWELAKAGNVHALWDIGEAISSRTLRIIGRPADAVSIVRDVTLLKIYGLQSYSLSSLAESASARRLYWNQIESAIPVLRNGNQAFKTCMLQSATQECVGIAAVTGRIPSLTEYANEIDLFLKNGAHVECGSV